MKFDDNLKNHWKLVSFYGYLYQRDWKQHVHKLAMQCQNMQRLSYYQQYTKGLGYCRYTCGTCRLLDLVRVEVKKLYSWVTEKAEFTLKSTCRIIRDQVLSQEAATKIWNFPKHFPTITFLKILCFSRIFVIICWFNHTMAFYLIAQRYITLKITYPKCWCSNKGTQMSIESML